jgi:hypothetical protein
MHMQHKKNETNFPVLIVSNALNGGGAEKTMFALHNRFIENHLDCHFLALNQGGEVPSDSHNVQVLSRKWKSGLKDTFSNYFDYIRIVKSINPKIIILNCELPELYGALLLLRKCKIIGVEHTSIPWRKKRLLGSIVRFILRIKKTEWASVISDQKKVWRSGTTCTYIPNPFIEDKISKTLKPSNPSLTFIGGLKNGKRPEWVIKASLNLKIEAHIYGNGIQRDLLETRYKDASDLIKFHGFKDKVWNYVPCNSLVVVPSEFEGDGMVVVEAILQDYPIILARNQDLLRFGLGEKHYFSDLEQLIEIIGRNYHSNFVNLKVPDDLVLKLKEERSLGNVYAQWIDFLGIKS